MSVLTVMVDDVKADIVKVEDWFKETDWAAKAAYFQAFIKGLETVVAPIVEALFPGTSSTINDVVTPLLDQANKAVGALTTAAQDYAAGNISAADLTTAAHTVQAAVIAANVIVSAAQVSVKTPVPVAPVAAPVIPAVTSNLGQ